MIVVLDDVHVSGVDDILAAMPQTDTWFSFNQHSCIDELIDISKRYFDLSQSIGYEMHKNIKGPNYHYDKDENLYHTTGILSFPLCSIVYYPVIEDMQGGELVFDTFMLKPIPNRLVLFSSNLKHGVNPYIGNRISIGINPWKEKPMKYRVPE